jgi:hypothetical protein
VAPLVRLFGNIDAKAFLELGRDAVRQAAAPSATDTVRTTS